MKIYNTKHCLTKGIIEHDVLSKTDSGRVCISGGKCINPDLMDWHYSKETAIKRAEYMRDSKIRMLQNQIVKTKLIKFN